MNNISDYIVRRRQEIVNYLMLLIKDKCLINLRFSEGDSFLTTSIAIDNDLLICDSGPKEYLNKHLAESQSATFRTTYSGIRVEFKTNQIDRIRFKGEDAFAMPIPDNLLWLQRRQYYRVKSPLSKASYVTIDIEDQPIQLPLYDISLSGFSMLIEADNIEPFLLSTREFKNCPMVLDGIGENAVSFEVLNAISLNPNKPDKSKKIGCRFTKIAPSFESGIQRYMQQIERELKQKN